MVLDRERLGQLIYEAVYASQGGKWSAVEPREVWYDKADWLLSQIGSTAYLQHAGEGEAEPMFQQRVEPWMDACFGPAISNDRLERGDRMLEEVLEALQSGDYPKERVAALTEYTYGRPKGEPFQEIGGVMVTVAAYCLAHGIDMHAAAEAELARIWTKVDKIRAKQASKPVGSALPIAFPAAPHPHQAPEGWQPIETAPKGKRVLVAWPQMPYDKIPWAIQVAKKSEQGGAWRSTLDSSVLPEPPTHWQPLPAPPASPSAKQASASADQGGE